VVVVLAPKYVDVYRTAGCDRKRVEDVREHLRREVADLLALHAQVRHAERPRADVYDGTRERLSGGRLGTLKIGEGWDVRTSSSGAKPVPYRRMPRTSPSACLNAVPNAIALSCAQKVRT
jgi:hypothetical protein